MNFKLTAILLVFVVLVGGYFFFVDVKTPSNNDQNSMTGEGEEGTPLFTADELSTTAVDRMKIEAGGTLIEVVRDKGEWNQVQPVHFVLDSWSVEPVRDDVASLRYTRKLVPGKDCPKLEDIGLAPPLATVTLVVGGSKPGTFIVKVGNKAQGGRAYVMVEGKPDVYLVGDALERAVVDAKPQEWRRRTLAAPRPDRTDSISLQHQSTTVSAAPSLTGEPISSTTTQTLEMVRHGEVWALSGHDRGRVDADKVKELLTTLSALHIDKFIADKPVNLAEYGLDKPSLTLTVQSTPAPDNDITSKLTKPAPGSATPAPTPAPAPAPAPGSPATQAAGSQPAPITQVLRVGGKTNIEGDAYFATWTSGDEPGNVVFTILKADREKLDKTTRDFRDARLTTFPQDDINEISVEQPGRHVALERGDKGNWEFRAPGTSLGTSLGTSPGTTPSFAPDNDAVSELLSSLTDIRADRFIPDAKPPGEPLATIRLAAKGHAEPDVLRVYAAPGAGAGAASAPAARADEVPRLVMRNSESTGLVVTAARLGTALAPVVTLRDRTILDAKPDQLKSIRLVRAGLPPGNVDVLLTRDVPATTNPAPAPAPGSSKGEQPSTWHLAGAQRIDPASLDALLAAVAPLRAEQWAGTEKPNAKDATGAIDIELTSTSGKTMAARVYPASRLGSLPPATDAFFKVSRNLPDVLQAEFHDRTISSGDVNDLQNVTVTDAKPGIAARAAVITQTELNTFQADTIKSVSQANAGQLFATLADLHAVRYIAPPALPGPANAGRTIKAQFKGGKAVELFLPAGAGLDATASTTGADGTVRWFTISDEAAKKLRADLEAPAKTDNPT